MTLFLKKMSFFFLKNENLLLTLVLSVTISLRLVTNMNKQPTNNIKRVVLTLS